MARDRLDAVSIRIGVAPDQTAAALAVLGPLHPNLTTDTVYLVELPTGSPPLAQSGVNVLMGVFDDGHRLVVQVRRVLRARLRGDWSEFVERDGETLTIEEERDRVRRVLTASLSSARGDPAMFRFDEETVSADVLSNRQRDFLEDCSVVRLRDRAMRLLGPITVESWTEVLAGLETRASRWTLADPGGRGFDALALRCRTTPERADFVLPVLASALRILGIDPDGGSDWPEERASAYWRSS